MCSFVRAGVFVVIHRNIIICLLYVVFALCSEVGTLVFLPLSPELLGGIDLCNFSHFLSAYPAFYLIQCIFFFFLTLFRHAKEIQVKRYRFVSGR
jgi:hypothetical protein